jgi:hypothetical protein
MVHLSGKNVFSPIMSKNLSGVPLILDAYNLVLRFKSNSCKNYFNEMKKMNSLSSHYITIKYKAMI